MERLTLEIVADSALDAINAAKGGADRVEFCSALFLGGLTPTVGAFRAVREVSDIPLFVMLRPRQAGFNYSEVEFDVLLKDGDVFVEEGADGLVLGLLNDDQTLDLERLKIVRERFPDTPLVFHRAFDLIRDWKTALDQLAELGFVRILTSGGANVRVGRDRLKEMQEYANGRIEIMAGGGLKPDFLDELIATTGIRSVHMNLRSTVVDSTGNNDIGLHFGGALYPPEDRFGVIDPDKVRAVVDSQK